MAASVLRARTLGRGIELSGVAADRNFASYRLDWARIEQPNQWNVLTAATSLSDSSARLAQDVRGFITSIRAA